MVSQHVVKIAGEPAHLESLMDPRFKNICATFLPTDNKSAADMDFPAWLLHWAPAPALYPGGISLPAQNSSACPACHLCDCVFGDGGSRDCILCVVVQRWFWWKSSERCSSLSDAPSSQASLLYCGQTSGGLARAKLLPLRPPPLQGSSMFDAKTFPWTDPGMY